MHEAIDYNALGWVRKELGETLKQARLQLEEYAENTGNETLLQGCAAHLHEALGPLQMVNIKGAVLLATEMEGVVADLQQGTVEEAEVALKEAILEKITKEHEIVSKKGKNLSEIKRDIRANDLDKYVIYSKTKSEGEFR